MEIKKVSTNVLIWYELLLPCEETVKFEGNLLAVDHKSHGGLFVLIGGEWEESKVFIFVSIFVGCKFLMQNYRRNFGIALPKRVKRRKCQKF